MTDERILDLAAVPWRFRACADTPALLHGRRWAARWMTAQIPGTVHGQLLRLGKIPDPCFGRNELDAQWIDPLDWEFRCHFQATARDCARARQELVFDGLDTVATILLNGGIVGRSANMFRQTICDVRGRLKPGRNQLVVRLHSPIAASTAAAQAAPDDISNRAPRTREVTFKWQTGEQRLTHRTWIRKTQCHFGWDWGLCLPTLGVWQPARLACSDRPRLVSLTVAQEHAGPPGNPREVRLTLRVQAAHPGPFRGELTLACAGQSVRTPLVLGQGTAGAEAVITITHPDLWWPRGQGGQPLYEITAGWPGEAPALRQRVGLRTIELDTTPDTTPDGSPAAPLVFRVNGRAIFAKGANWIPPDQFVERCTPGVYRHLLQSMAAAHMNMVRVWGGGWYELDVFYNLCDELGLLVWQDFMMACGLYPGTAAFQAELAAEAREQVRRLQHHACIALWCGDNENLTGVNHWWSDPDHAGEIRDSYEKLMTGLRRVVQEEDPTRPFRVSSPSNGWIDGQSESPDLGDIHCWAVWHGQQPFSYYLGIRPRFCSEFGFQSFAEPRTMRACVPPGELNLTGWYMEHHQRTNAGNQIIANTIARELPLPRDFDAYCWSSQINQALAIRTAVEHWRRQKPWCAGALYWQVNDLWPVASWSSIDWHGRWKALHHAATRFFAPLLVSFAHDPDTDTVAVWATSDLNRPLNLRGSLLVMTWAGRPVARIPLRGRLQPDGNRPLASVKLAKLLGSLHLREVCLFAELSGDGVRGENHTALVPWKHVPLQPPDLRAALRQEAGGIALRLTCQRVAAFVHAEIEGTESHFNGSFEVLRPGRVYQWKLALHTERGQQPVSLADARKRLKLWNLYDLSEH